MENNAAQKEQSIGWEDVFNIATTISLGLYFFVNKKVSHNTWMYILAGACILAVGVCHFAYRRKLNKGKKKRAVTFNEVLHLRRSSFHRHRNMGTHRRRLTTDRRFNPSTLLLPIGTYNRKLINKT